MSKLNSDESYDQAAWEAARAGNWDACAKFRRLAASARKRGKRSRQKNQRKNAKSNRWLKDHIDQQQGEQL